MKVKVIGALITFVGIGVSIKVNMILGSILAGFGLILLTVRDKRKIIY